MFSVTSLNSDFQAGLKLYKLLYHNQTEVMNHSFSNENTELLQVRYRAGLLQSCLLSILISIITKPLINIIYHRPEIGQAWTAPCRLAYYQFVICFYVEVKLRNLMFA